MNYYESLNSIDLNHLKRREKWFFASMTRNKLSVNISFAKLICCTMLRSAMKIL